MMLKIKGWFFGKTQDAAKRYNISIDKATATIMQQAEEATRAMSKDIPDLEGAELKV